MENDMELFDDYLEQTVKGRDDDVGDIGSLLSLAILGSGSKFNYEQAIKALERATVALSTRSYAATAKEIFDSAIHHLQVGEEFQDE